MLGIKRDENAMKYIDQKVTFDDSEYETATATDAMEAEKIIQAGFDFVVEKQGRLIFRKRKRFWKICVLNGGLLQQVFVMYKVARYPEGLPFFVGAGPDW